MDQFEGDGILTQIHIVYNCGCEYSSGCHSQGEGFDFYCDEHIEEANHFRNTIDILMDERTQHYNNDIKVKEINDRIYDVSCERSLFHKKIKSNKSS
jgi:hypothetical protein